MYPGQKAEFFKLFFFFTYSLCLSYHGSPPTHFPVPSYLPSALAMSLQNKIKFKREKKKGKISLIMEAVM